MPETHEGKIQLAKLQQQLQDHVQTQAIELSEIKATANRIESKLDSKASTDDVRMALEVAAKKADKEDLKILDNRVWAALIAALMALLGAVLNFLTRGRL